MIRQHPFPLAVRPGLSLELANPAEAAAYFALVERNLPRLARWEPWANEPQTPAGVRVFLAWQAQGFNAGTLVPLLMRLDGQLVGSCSARIEAADATAEIGYWVDAAQEGKGVAAASVEALVGYLLGRGDIARVQARTAVDNTRSRALLNRLGFSFEGVLRGSQRLAGRHVDMAMYARLATDEVAAYAVD